MTAFRLSASLLAVGLVLLTGRTAAAQTTYAWNGTRTDWATASSWTPSGVPGAGDTALFENNVSANPLSLPLLTANAQARALHFDYNVVQLDTSSASATANAFLGNGHTLAVGGGVSQSFSPVRLSGSVNRIGFENLQVNLAAGTTLTGDAAVNGVLTIDAVNRLALLSNSNFQAFSPGGPALPITLNGGGFVVDGTSDLGSLTVRSFGGNMQFIGGASPNAPGTTIHGAGGIVALSGQTNINISQITSPPAGQFRNNVQVFFGGNGAPGLAIPLTSRGLVTFNVPLTAGTARIFLDGFGGLVSNGLIRDGNTPYVTITNSNGDMQWATYDAANGVVLGATVSRNGAALSNGVSTENVVSRPQGTTLTQSVTLGSLLFDQVTTDTLNLGGNTLTTNGVIMNTSVGTGSRRLTISNGTLAGTGGSVRHIMVNAAAAHELVLDGVNLASGGPIAKSGAGILVLAGTTDLVNFPNSTFDVSINSGSIRAVINGPQATFGLNNNLRLRGGFLTADALGGTATFTRTLGTGGGQVNWATGADDHGNGGFQAFNGNLTVNIGNDARTLTWDGRTGESQFFVRDGNTLRFNTPAGTGRIDFLNNLNLDGGTAGVRTSRVIEAFGNINLTSDVRPPAERTRLTGVISGGPSAALNYGFGSGFVEVTAANTYAGDTYIANRGLIVSNTSGSATGTGTVRVNQAMLMGSGIIAPASGKNVLIDGGFLILQSDAGPSNLTIGSAGADNDLSLRKRFATSGDTVLVTRAITPTQHGRLTFRGTGQIQLEPGTLLAVDFDPGFTPNAGTTLGIIDNQSGNPISGLFTQSGTGVLIDQNKRITVGNWTFQVSYTGDITGSTVIPTGGNDLVFHNFQPVPEPSGVLAVGAAAAGVVGFLRRRRRSAGSA